MQNQKANHKKIGILVLALLIAVAIAIFVLSLRGRERELIGPTETSAVDCLRELVAIEEIWRKNDIDRNGQNDYWTKDVAGFHYIQNANGQRQMYIPIEIAKTDPSVTNWGKDAKVTPYNGYYFKAIATDENGNAYNQNVVNTNLGAGAYIGQKCCNSNKFAFCAYPAEYNVTGVRTFIVNEKGIVYCRDLGDAKPIDKWPCEDPTKEGWGVSDF